MVVLDTNVLSELMRASPERNVIAWADAQPRMELSTTAICAAELLYGVARLPAGRRQRELRAAVEQMLGEDLAGRVHPFDLRAAAEYARIVSDRERAGRPISAADAQIAAVCRSLGARLATRDSSDFAATGIELIDPWRLPV